MASFQGSSQLALGNIFGSNVANILLILGVSAISCPLPITRNTYFSEIPFSLVATLLVGFLANANLFQEHLPYLLLSRFDGFVLLFFFSLFLGYVYIVSKQKSSIHEMEVIVEIPMTKSIVYIVLGIAGLYLGGEWVVDGAIILARQYGMSESLVGLTIVAIGTSLPELVTSITAALKKNTDIAVGNAIGSNIFNLLWILGLSAVLKPLEFDIINNTDIMMVIVSSTLLIMAVVIGKKPVISRWEGGYFVLAYVLYMVFLVYRG
jgi:cation:H+ antiporter